MDYGKYEGRRTAEILAERPDWQLFRDAAPEENHRIKSRADRIVSRLIVIHGYVLLFSSSHFLRVLTARWLGLKPAGGRYFLLSLGILSYEHITCPSRWIRLWNDARHVET